MTLPWDLILFYTFATVLVLAGLAVISVKNSVHAALFLVLAFFTSAALWCWCRRVSRSRWCWSMSAQ
jgi:NADH:ubiquinone oxidoreductase subunit 6 (subunit J)